MIAACSYVALYRIAIATYVPVCMCVHNEASYDFCIILCRHLLHIVLRSVLFVAAAVLHEDACLAARTALGLNTACASARNASEMCTETCRDLYNGII